MHQFKLQLESFTKIRNTAIRRTIRVMLLAGTTVIYIRVSSNKNDVDDIGTLPCLIQTGLISLTAGCLSKNSSECTSKTDALCKRLTYKPC